MLENVFIKNNTYRDDDGMFTSVLIAFQDLNKVQCLCTAII